MKLPIKCLSCDYRYFVTDGQYIHCCPATINRSKYVPNMSKQDVSQTTVVIDENVCAYWKNRCKPIFEESMRGKNDAES